MTRAECDSTTFNETSDQDFAHHAYGCTRMGAPCSSSLLRLALIAGSAYAVRFTTCIVNVSPSRGHLRTRRTHPYHRKGKHSASTHGSISPSEQRAHEEGLNCSTESKFVKDNTKIESTVERQILENFQSGFSKSLQSDKIGEQFETTTSLRPLRIDCKTEDNCFAEETSLPK